MKLTLVAAPAPAQFVEGIEHPLGTVRTHMHKAPLTALASWLRDDAEVSILDMQVDRTQTPYGMLSMGSLDLEKRRVGMTFEAADDLLADTDVVGINANFTHSRRIIADFIDHLRQTDPDRRVIVGGTDATADPAFFLRHGAEVVVRGEGELVMRDLLRVMERGEKPVDLPNVSYMTSEGVKHNATKFLREQLDMSTIPPHALDLVRLDSYIDTGEGFPPPGVVPPYISIETSRGCAQACSFCATPQTKGRFRYMSTSVAREHLEYYKANGVRTLLFQEDNLLSRVQVDHRADSNEGRTNLLELFAIARDLGFAWEFTNGIEYGQFESEGRIDLELIEAMFWRGENGDGCYRATLPLENVLDDGPMLFRKIKPASIGWPVIEAIADCNVQMLTFNVIVGRPNESLRTLRTTYDRCRALHDLIGTHGTDVGTYFNVYLLSLLPGTVDFRHFSHMLAYDLEVDPEVITFYLGSLNTENFTPEDLTRARGSLSSALNGDSLISDFDEAHYLTSDKVDALLA
jgi:hypothetical protein